MTSNQRKIFDFFKKNTADKENVPPAPKSPQIEIAHLQLTSPNVKTNKYSSHKSTKSVKSQKSMRNSKSKNRKVIDSSESEENDTGSPGEEIIELASTSHNPNHSQSKPLPKNVPKIAAKKAPDNVAKTTSKPDILTKTSSKLPYPVSSEESIVFEPSRRVSARKRAKIDYSEKKTNKSVQTSDSEPEKGVEEPSEYMRKRRTPLKSTGHKGRKSTRVQKSPRISKVLQQSQDEETATSQTDSQNEVRQKLQKVSKKSSTLLESSDSCTVDSDQVDLMQSNEKTEKNNQSKLKGTQGRKNLVKNIPTIVPKPSKPAVPKTCLQKSENFPLLSTYPEKLASTQPTNIQQTLPDLVCFSDSAEFGSIFDTDLDPKKLYSKNCFTKPDFFYLNSKFYCQSLQNNGNAHSPSSSTDSNNEGSPRIMHTISQKRVRKSLSTWLSDWLQCLENGGKLLHPDFKFKQRDISNLEYEHNGKDGNTSFTPAYRYNEMEDFIDDSQDSQDDEERGFILPNSCYVSGGTGSGKTSMVYELAEELGFEVIEINCSEKRSGMIFDKIIDSLQSRNAKNKVKSSKIFKMFGSKKTEPKKTETEILSTEKIEILSDSEQESKSESIPELSSEPVAESKPKQIHTLILLDDVNCIIDEGFWDAGIFPMVKETKTPIIMTSQLQIPLDPEDYWVFKKLTRDRYIFTLDLARSLKDFRKIGLRYEFWGGNPPRTTQSSSDPETREILGPSVTMLENNEKLNAYRRIEDTMEGCTNFKHDKRLREFYIYSEDQLKTGVSELNCCFSTLPYLQKIRKIISKDEIARMQLSRRRSGKDKFNHFSRESLFELEGRVRRTKALRIEDVENGDENGNTNGDSEDRAEESEGIEKHAAVE